jgi:hypothetical protein
VIVAVVFAVLLLGFWLVAWGWWRRRVWARRLRAGQPAVVFSADPLRRRPHDLRRERL